MSLEGLTSIPLRGLLCSIARGSSFQNSRHSSPRHAWEGGPELQLPTPDRVDPADSGDEFQLEQIRCRNRYFVILWRSRAMFFFQLFREASGDEFQMEQIRW